MHKLERSTAGGYLNAGEGVARVTIATLLRGLVRQIIRGLASLVVGETAKEDSPKICLIFPISMVFPRKTNLIKSLFSKKAIQK